jgi:hypothetical protein
LKSAYSRSSGSTLSTDACAGSCALLLTANRDNREDHAQQVVRACCRTAGRRARVESRSSHDFLMMPRVCVEVCEPVSVWTSAVDACGRNSAVDAANELSTMSTRCRRRTRTPNAYAVVCGAVDDANGAALPNGGREPPSGSRLANGVALATSQRTITTQFYFVVKIIRTQSICSFKFASK